jgi:serine phosphatase RsbU (regulator of sigma subunit)
MTKNSILYLTTDGFIDQHSDINNKFGTPRLLQLFSSTAEAELQIQKELIENEFLHWKVAYMQIDDVTIWGIKL